jgi:hypothetical protein
MTSTGSSSDAAVAADFDDGVPFPAGSKSADHDR